MARLRRILGRACLTRARPGEPTMSPMRRTLIMATLDGESSGKRTQARLHVPADDPGPPQGRRGLPPPVSPARAVEIRPARDRTLRVRRDPGRDRAWLPAFRAG